MSVLVLNAGYEPLHRVSLQHAIRMLARNVAVVEEIEHGQTIGPYPRPRVLRLIRYVTMRWRRKAPRWSRTGSTGEARPSGDGERASRLPHKQETVGCECRPRHYHPLPSALGLSPVVYLAARLTLDQSDNVRIVAGEPPADSAREGAS